MSNVHVYVSIFNFNTKQFSSKLLSLFFFQERKYTIQSTEPRANLRTRRPLATRHVALSNDRENENPERKLKLKFLMVNKWNFYPSNRIHNVS